MTIKNSGRDPAYSVGFKFDFKKDLQVESVTDETNVCRCFLHSKLSNHQYLKKFWYFKQK